jgi:hypothetical protein
VAWSAGHDHEDAPGQQPHFALSNDLKTWTSPCPVVETDGATGIVRNLAGIYADSKHLYALVGSLEPEGIAEPGMKSMDSRSMRLDLYRTSDLNHWEEFQGIAEDIYLFEGPRPTREGALLCAGIRASHWGEMVVLLWDDSSDLMKLPSTQVLSGEAQGVIPEQGTWYETDAGRIYMWYRDGGSFTRLAVNWSDDSGHTWSPIIGTTFQNTFSRAHAGRLVDGRYYIIGNNFDQYLNRLHMHIALSDDGETFDRMYTLLSGPTTRRVPGRHKEDGYHYPNSIVDGDQLIVVYSVNKEDIEVAVVDTTTFD